MGLEQVELVMDAEDEFGITIDTVDDYGQSAMTVAHFTTLFCGLYASSPAQNSHTRPDLEAPMYGSGWSRWW